MRAPAGALQEGMLSPDPATRITLEDIKLHPWFNGTVLSPDELSAAMAVRKAHVDSEKQKAKLLAAAKTAGNPNAAAGCRGGSGGSANAGALPEPPAFKRENAIINGYNTFRATVAPVSLLASLEEVMREHAKGNFESTYVTEYELTTKLFNELEIGVNVFSDPDAGDQKAYIVQVDLLKGDKFQFRRVFNLLENQVVDAPLPEIRAPVPPTAQELAELKRELQFLDD